MNKPDKCQIALLLALLSFIALLLWANLFRAEIEPVKPQVRALTDWEVLGISIAKVQRQVTAQDSTITSLKSQIAQLRIETDRNNEDLMNFFD